MMPQLAWTDETGQCETHTHTHTVLILRKTAGESDRAALEATAAHCQHHFAASILTGWKRRKWQKVVSWWRLMGGVTYWEQGINKWSNNEEERRRQREKDMGEKGGEIWGKVGGVRQKSDREGARGEQGGNADGHVSMGAQERFGVRDSCIIAASQWKGSVKMFKGSVLATAE